MAVLNQPVWITARKWKAERTSIDMADTPIPTPQQMAQLWRSRYKEMQETRSRTKAVRDWLAGKVDPVVPKDFAEAAKMGIKLPHAVTLALHTVQLLSHKLPRLRRTAI